MIDLVVNVMMIILKKETIHDQANNQTQMTEEEE